MDRLLDCSLLAAGGSLEQSSGFGASMKDLKWLDKLGNDVE